jgi:plastocyanin
VAALGLSLLGLLLTASGARVDAASRSFDITASKYRFDPEVVEVEQGDRVSLRVRSADSDHSLEKQAGGHAFQINFSNDLGTTPAPVARGRTGWFIGFNLTRKFY